ncbi:hypothetical protein D3C74_258740 [compost metagenome]
MRESGKVVYDNGRGFINAYVAYPASRLKYGTYKPFLGIYKNEQLDTSWGVSLESVSKQYQAGLSESVGFDRTANYSVTYIMTDLSPIVPFTGSYASNEKTLLADLVDSVQQNTARVSVLENKKADKDNPAWLTPTLLNGWVVWVGSQGTYTPGYYKDSAGVVHLRGWIKDGAKAQATVIFRLPVGYRPSQRSLFTVYDSSDTGTNLKTSAVVVNVDGSVAVDSVSGTSVSFYQVSFLAEQ